MFEQRGFHIPYICINIYFIFIDTYVQYSLHAVFGLNQISDDMFFSQRFAGQEGVSSPASLPVATVRCLRIMALAPQQEWATIMQIQIRTA